MIPSRTVSANCPALPRVMWPKYCSFSFATLPINSLSRPNSVNIESFVRKAGQKSKQNVCFVDPTKKSFGNKYLVASTKYNKSGIKYDALDQR